MSKIKEVFRINKSTFAIILLFLLMLSLFRNTLLVYFVQDDFYLLSISKIIRLSDIFTFFVPLKDTVWYRPLSSQVFFGIGQIFFGANPLLFHLVVFCTHLCTTYLVYYLIAKEYKQEKIGLLSAFIYGIHQAHTVSLSWLASYSFVLGPFFLLFTFLLFKKRKYWSALTYFLGLLTSEVLVIFLLWVIGFYFITKTKINLKQVSIFLILSLITLIIRFYLFPSDQNNTYYAFDLSIQIFSTIKFYLTAMIGLPMLVDQMPILIKAIVYTIGSVLLFVSLLGVIAYSKFSQFKSQILPFFVSITIIGLTPFLLLSNHIAPHYVSFSLLGFAYLFATLIMKGSYLFPVQIRNTYVNTILLLFIVLQIIAIEWTFDTHWIFRRAELAKKLVNENNLQHLVGTEEYFSLGANTASQVFGK